jgi:hypothetical protein
MKGYAVQVSADATMIVGGRTADETRATSGSVAYPAAALIRNPESGLTVYLGGEADGTGGFPLGAGEDIEVDLVGEILYGVVSTTSTTLYILRRGD